MSLRPPLRVSTFQSRTVVSMFGRLCHLFVHALSSLQVANAQCMTLRSLAPCLRAAREKHRFAAGKKHRNGKKRVWQQEKNALQREKAVSAAGKNASKKCRFAARKIQSSRKNTLQQHKSTFAAEKMHFGGSGKKPSEAGKNPSEARKKPAEAGKKPAAEKVQLCNPKSCRNGKNTFPQREKAAAQFVQRKFSGICFTKDESSCTFEALNRLRVQQRCAQAHLKQLLFQAVPNRSRSSTGPYPLQLCGAPS